MVTYGKTDPKLPTPGFQVNSEPGLEVNPEPDLEVNPEPGLEVRTPFAGGFSGTPRRTFAYYSNSQPQSVPQHDEKDQIRRHPQGPWGLNIILFTCLTALFAAIIVGAVLSGGLGARIAQLQNENNALKKVNAATPTRTLTLTPSSTSASPIPTALSSGGIQNFVVTPPTAIDTVSLDCPAIDGDEYDTVRGQAFTMHCGVSLVRDDIASILAYTVADCIEACSSINWFYSGTGNQSLCTAVAFGSEIDSTYPEQHANCWLKYGAIVNALNVTDTISAQLIPNMGNKKRSHSGKHN